MAQYPKDRAGNDLMGSATLPLEGCFRACMTNPQGREVSYEASPPLCVMKSATCPAPGDEDNGFIFYALD